MPFQVRVVSRTWKSGTPIERPVPRPSTLRCANMLAPGRVIYWLSSLWCFRYAWFLAPGSPEPQQIALYRGSRVRKATFFTRCISLGSSATPYFILRWRSGSLHTDSCAGSSVMRNCLNISIIREMSAHSYIAPFVFSSTGAISSVYAPMAVMELSWIGLSTKHQTR